MHICCHKCVLRCLLSRLSEKKGKALDDDSTAGEAGESEGRKKIGTKPRKRRTTITCIDGDYITE
jgi:hypothetical protein